MLSVFLTVSSAYADDPVFAEPRYFGTGSDATTSVALGDMDGDGDLDIVAGNKNQPNAVYLNDGDGHYDLPGAARSFGPGTATESVALGDLDGDGDLDIVTGNRSQANVLYLNDGAGGFYTDTVDCATPPANARCFGTESDETYSIAVADIDGDADLDVAVANAAQQNAVYLNDGQGQFHLGTLDCGNPDLRCFGPGTDSTAALAVGDVDDDGDLDIVAGNSGENVVYFNDGSGSFPSGTGLGDSWISTEVVLSDLDGDVDLDIVVGNTFGQNEVYLNNGTGFFTETRTFGGFYTEDVAVGDMDGDGDLDIAVGNSGMWGAEQNMIYLNDGTANFSAGLDLGGEDWTDSIAVGDVNGDGHLDAVEGNGDQQNVIYLNDGGGSLPDQRAIGSDSWTAGVAVGDMDGDSDLDIVVGNYWNNSLIHLNGGSGTFPITHLVGPTGDSAQAVALGDVDGDADLDIVVGRNGDYSLIYLNDGAAHFFTGTVDCGSPPPSVRCFGTGSDLTFAVALADVNGDGPLDIIAGRNGQLNHVYVNDGAGHYDWPGAARPFGTDTDPTRSIAVGDLDGDGDPDIVAGNYTGRSQIFLNDGAGNYDWEGCARSFGTADSRTRSVSLGDLDGDGDLDIVAGNNGQPNYTYLNDGGGHYDWPGASHTFGSGLDHTWSVAVGDMDGDGDLDILSGNAGSGDSAEQNAIYLNGGSGQFGWDAPVRAFGTGYDWTVDVALGELNGDGTLDIVVGNNCDWCGGEINRIYLNHLSRPARLANTLPYPAVSRPGSTADGEGYSTAEVLESSTIPISYTLYDIEGDPLRFIHAFYSPDGGGRWLPAVATTETLTMSLSASPWPSGTLHTFTWDTFSSGFFGQSDNVVFRLEAYPSLRPFTDTVAGPYQYPYAATATFPFRVRGTQVRVLSGTLPLSGALVYRIPAGQLQGEAIADGAGRPYRTDAQGYLQGRGTILPGDGLVALVPLSATDSYTLCLTSASPTPEGLAAYTVTQAGVQTLTVSPANPLLLLNLAISLEWDARYDPQYLDRLSFDLQRASQALYDWSNGQAALGQVRVYQARQEWLTAHLRVYVSNRVRPSAAQGGVISEIVTDSQVLTLTYAPGQVQMGAVWNRYGDPGGGMGEDWARTLAHELGHYAFFLDDNYLGLNEAGQLIPVEGCPGAMSDPYREDEPYDEFHAAADWLPACEQTLSHQSTGRSDWETIALFYPELAAYGTVTNTGPAGLPLAVTQIDWVEPLTPSVALPDPTFYLFQGGGHAEPGPTARAILFQGDRLIDLGRPVLDYVLARGAAEGDRLCVYELAAERLGCETITAGDQQIELAAMPDWQPDLTISPVNSMTVALTVTNLPGGLELWGRLYPSNDPAPAAVPLVETAGGYTATLEAGAPALAGYVQLWVEEAAPRREIVTDFALGGNPGTIRGRWGTIRGRWGTIRGRWAPAVSADGQVIIFGQDLDFEEGSFYTLQAATVIPTPPSWVTVVGQAYRLAASPEAPDLSTASISFRYMGHEVPSGEEEWLRVYFWDGASWQPLATQLDLYHNQAAATVAGEGLYVLMSSIEIPLQAGWNSLGYPVAQTRSVTETLRSIEGAYGLVYHYDPAAGWTVYGPGAPGWVNDLEAFEFGESYWISTTEAITLYLRGAAGGEMAGGFPFPPATYYGTLSGGAAFSPTPGMTVTAWVEGTACGEGQTLEVGGQVVYRISAAAEVQTAGCGAPGRKVVFRVGAQPMAPRAPWNNSRLWLLPLRPNTPPTISHIPDLTTTAGTVIGPIGFTVEDPDVPAEDLALYGESSNPLLLPSDQIIFGGAGISRTVTLTPAGLLTGTAVITIRVDDGIESATTAFTLTVTGPPLYRVYLPLICRGAAGTLLRGIAESSPPGPHR